MAAPAPVLGAAPAARADGSGSTPPGGPSATATTWTRVAAGPAHTCGIRSDGTLWCWGENLHGQLGDGTTTPRLVPKQIA